jgi:hypothetical protein
MFIEQGSRNTDELAADCLALIVSGIQQIGGWTDDLQAMLILDQHMLESIKEVGVGMTQRGYTEDPFEIVGEWEKRAEVVGILAYADGEAGIYIVTDEEQEDDS